MLRLRLKELSGIYSSMVSIGKGTWAAESICNVRRVEQGNGGDRCRARKESHDTTGQVAEGAEENGWAEAVGTVHEVRHG